MPPYTLAPITAADRETISTIFCFSYTSNGYFRLQYPGMSIAEMIPGFALRFPAGKLSRPNTWHYKLLDAAQNNEPIAFARWILPERLFQKVSAELNSQGGVMGVEGESEENMLRYAEEREQGYVNGEPVGMNPRVPEEASVEFGKLRALVTYPEYIVLATQQQINYFLTHYNRARRFAYLAGARKKGAGTALVEWGIRLADSEGLPITLQSTSHGIGLYRNWDL